MQKTIKDKIIQALIEQKHIPKKDMDDAIAEQKRKAIGLDKILVDRGLVTEQELLGLLVKEFGMPSINLSKYKIDPALKDLIPEQIARQYHVIPLSVLSRTLTVGISDPFNIFLVDDLKSLTGHDIDITISTDTEILKAINAYYGSKDNASVSDVSKEIDVEDFEIVGSAEQEGGAITIQDSEEAPIIRMVDLFIKEALKQRASDIHIEPAQNNVRVRFRIDGTLQDILEIPKANQNAVIVRVKIMSRIDITETRIPQDGRFKMRVANREVDFRVSLLPTIFGQKVVMRILDKGSLGVGLDGLGFFPETVEQLKEAIAKPFGMILITGPTGSGKSTTLYSIISQLNTIEKNIITVEDPVEYQLEGITQIHVRPEIGLTFASGLRAILRQSPDIVMVGEIRDSETADIAIKAALTGQMVFSTLHTNDSAGAMTRLVDMGVESFLVASSVIMICAQRLARKICSNCKQPVDVPDQVLKTIGFKPEGKVTFYQGKGCEACRQTGYRGRMGVLEVLVIEEKLREMLIRGASSDEIKDYAIKHLGMRTLREDALKKFSMGLTTVEEVLRITSDML